MEFKKAILDYGYDFQDIEKPFIKVRKRDEQNICDIVIIFDPQTKTIGGGLITLVPISTIDDISHQYAKFREFDKDIQYFSNKTGYDIIEL